MEESMVEIVNPHFMPRSQLVSTEHQRTPTKSKGARHSKDYSPPITLCTQRAPPTHTQRERENVCVCSQREMEDRIVEEGGHKGALGRSDITLKSVNQSMTGWRVKRKTDGEIK